MEIVHNINECRFETTIRGLTAFLNYRIVDNRLVITHTEVPGELEGQGIGSTLVRKCLEYARDNLMKVETHCWFARVYLERHPEYQDLLA